MAHEIERCKSIFVSWRWLVGLLAGLIVTVGSLAWAGGAQISEVKVEQRQTAKKVDECTASIAEIRGVKSDLDTIKTLLRK